MKKIIAAILLACFLAVGVLPQTVWAEATDITYLENELREVRRQLDGYTLEKMRMEMFLADWEPKREILGKTYKELQQFYEQGKEINRNNLIKKTVSLGIATYETSTAAVGLGSAAAKKAVAELAKWSIEQAAGEGGKALAGVGSPDYYNRSMSPFTTAVGKTLPELQLLSQLLDMDLNESRQWLKTNEGIELTDNDATILARWRVLLEKTEKAQTRLADMIRQGDMTTEDLKHTRDNWPPSNVLSLQEREKDLRQRLEAAREKQARNIASQESQAARDAAEPSVRSIPLVPMEAGYREGTFITEHAYKREEAYELLQFAYPPLAAALKEAADRYDAAVAEANGLRDNVLKQINEPILSLGDYMTRPPELVAAEINQKPAVELETAIFGARWRKELIDAAKADLDKAIALFGQAAEIVKAAADKQAGMERLNTLDSFYGVYECAMRNGRDVSYKNIQAALPIDRMEVPLIEQDRLMRLLRLLDDVYSTQNIILAKAEPALKQAKELEQKQQAALEAEFAAKRQKEQEEQSPRNRFRLLAQKVADNSQAWLSLPAREFFLETLLAKEEANRLAGSGVAAEAAGLIRALSDLEEQYRAAWQPAETENQGNTGSMPEPIISQPDQTPAQPEHKAEEKPLPVPAAKPLAVKTDTQLLPADYQQQVRETLAVLAVAYQQENLRGFMQLVSPDFLGDDFLLDRALRRDFRAFDNINLRLSASSINIDARGRAQVLTSYNRSVASQKDGQTYIDRGLTQFTFHLHNGKVKLYDMRYPIIFGVSEASQLATGEVRTMENEKILTVNRRGDTAVLPYNEAKLSSEQSGVKRGTNIRLQFSYMPEIVQGWSFADNRRTHPNSYHTVEGDFTFTTQWLNLAPGTSFRRLSVADVDDVTEVPDPAVYPYTVSPYLPEHPDVLPDGMGVYALRLSSGNYAVIKMVSYIHLSEFVFDYKYQPSGSRSF